MQRDEPPDTDIEAGNVEVVDIEVGSTEAPPQGNEDTQSTNSDHSRDCKVCTCCSKDVLKNLLYLAVIIICALIAVVVYLYLIPCPVCSTPEMATCPPEATTGASISQNNTSQDSTSENDSENKPLPQRFYDENYMR